MRLPVTYMCWRTSCAYLEPTSISPTILWVNLSGLAKVLSIKDLWEYPSLIDAHNRHLDQKIPTSGGPPFSSLPYGFGIPVHPLVPDINAGF